MIWGFGVFVVLIAGILTWFRISYSPMKAEFNGLLGVQLSKIKSGSEVFTAEDISGLPLPVQKYFIYCGFIGKPKMSDVRIYYNDVDFILSPDKPKLKIKYTQCNFVDKPERLAYIDTSMYGIPFEGIDAYQNGGGSMKGMFAKVITLFDQSGPEFNMSSLVNCLAESLLVPNAALQDYIKWVSIDDTHAKGIISYYGLTAEGIFTFDTEGRMLNFTTDDRINVSADGKFQNVKWSVGCEDYKDIGGIMFPSHLKAIWNYDSGDLLYFDGRDISVEYDIKTVDRG
ncbi:MAG TPA: DUF6544 family protein [Clostridia bacterium]|nr:DUF6544 family protein [Clostridia bacterium]